MLKYLPILMLLSFLQGCFSGGFKLRWQVPIASDITPVVQNGTVYVQGFPAGHPEEPYKMYALDALTGAQKWVSADSVYEIYGESGGYVFYRNNSDHLVQLDAGTGAKIHESGDDVPVIRNWVISGDIMYILNASMQVVAVDNRQNAVLWLRQLPFGPGDRTNLQMAGKQLIVSGDFRDNGEHYGLIWGMDAATGTENWHFEVPPPHDYAPLEVVVSDPYVLATNTSPLNLQTHVLDIHTGKDLYPPLPIFTIYGCHGDLAYSPKGTYNLKTGQRTAETPNWGSGSIYYKGTMWQRRISSLGLFDSFRLRNTYDGDYRGRRDWTDSPPCSSIQGFDPVSGNLVHETKIYKYTRFSPPVEANGVLFHTSMSMMKEGKSGVWAYRLPD